MTLPESYCQQVRREAERIVDQPAEHQVWLFSSMTREVLGRGMCTDGVRDYVRLPIQQIIKESKPLAPYWVLLMHQHPNGAAYPSDRDLRTLASATYAFHRARLQMDDYVIVGRDRQGIVLWSARDAGFL